MRRKTTGFHTMGFFVMCLTLALAVGGGCKKEPKGGGGGGKGGGGTVKDPPKKVKPAGPVIFDMAARKKITDNATYTKRELYKTMVKKIPEVAEACRKAKKYVSSLTWCPEFKALKKDADAVFKDMKGSEPKTVRRSMAIVAAAAKNLKNESLFVRFTSLELINWGIYRMAWGKADPEAKAVRRLLAWVYKKDKDKQARAKAITILGGSGGAGGGWRGDAQDARVLFHAASKDAEDSVRYAALSYLRYCVKKTAACPLTPKKVKAWYAAESKKRNKDKLAEIAGRMKMTEEVFKWCQGPLDAGKLGWGCTYGLGFVANSSTAERIFKMANTYKDSETSKKKGDYTTKYLAEVMVKGIKNGLPKDKAVGFLVAVLGQPETLTMRSASTATYIVRNLSWMAKSKDEAKKWGKLIKKAQKRYKKAWAKDKYKKSYLKSFADSLKTLKKKSA